MIYTNIKIQYYEDKKGGGANSFLFINEMSDDGIKIGIKYSYLVLVLKVSRHNLRVYNDTTN